MTNEIEDINSLKETIKKLKSDNASLMRKLTGVRRRMKKEIENHNEKINSLRECHKKELDLFTDKKMKAEIRYGYYYLAELWDLVDKLLGEKGLNLDFKEKCNELFNHRYKFFCYLSSEKINPIEYNPDFKCERPVESIDDIFPDLKCTSKENLEEIKTQIDKRLEDIKNGKVNDISYFEMPFVKYNLLWNK